ncbi:SRPBCC family protein [Nocardia brasiliensis]|uniref:SRPBCC family protein n=1 Tax=Nocardia brasiliensis TaxID=37326 RepID=UPI002453B8C5|nr:SRPBCC family protein [Nocardia brasiliensis]
MASVRKELVVDADPAQIWDIIRDFADGPTRMAPGFAVRSALEEPGYRVVDFADGSVLRERLVVIEEDERRFVYSIVGGSVTPEHNNACMQVFPHGAGQTRFVWTHDVLPDALAEPFAAAMDNGLAVFGRSVASTTTP